MNQFTLPINIFSNVYFDSQWLPFIQLSSFWWGTIIQDQDIVTRAAIVWLWNGYNSESGYIFKRDFHAKMCKKMTIKNCMWNNWAVKTYVKVHLEFHISINVTKITLTFLVYFYVDRNAWCPFTHVWFQITDIYGWYNFGVDFVFSATQLCIRCGCPIPDFNQITARYCSPDVYCI